MQQFIQTNKLQVTTAILLALYFFIQPVIGRAAENEKVMETCNDHTSMNGNCTTTYGSATVSNCNSYLWNGISYTASGNYTQTFMNAEGCDSIHEIYLTILESNTIVQTVVTLSNYTWPVNNVTYTSSNNVSVTYSGANISGCDSTMQLNLSILSLSLQVNQHVSCYGLNDGSIQSIVVGNPGPFVFDLDYANLYTNNTGLFNGLSAGQHTVCVIHVASGLQLCQTVTITQASPITAVFTIDSTASCLGNDGQISVNISGGVALLQPYQTSWTNQASAVITPIINNNTQQTIGNLPSGNYFLHVQDELGCTLNSMVTLDSNPPITLSFSTSATSCVTNLNPVSASATGGFGNINITLGGNPFPSQLSPGNYIVLGTDAKGCTATASLDIYDPYHFVDEWYITTCGTYTWPVNNQTYSVSGNYTVSFTNTFGCDSNYVLVLTANAPSVNPNQVEFGCGSFFWTATWQTYTASGIYTASLTNVYGCDSVVTLDLTVTPGTYLDIKAMLAGAYDPATGLMHDSLRAKNLIPLTEPYSAAPYNRPVVGELNGETVSPVLLGLDGTDAIVDWVLIEVRDATNPATLIATKRALIQRDGDVVSSIDGYSPVYLSSVAPGNYYLSIKHRNHLGVMTNAPLAISACALHTIDFINGPVYTYSGFPNGPQNTSSGVKLLWGGDANYNKNIKYNGSQSDKMAILNVVGITTSNNIVNGYLPADVNLDGRVRYNGYGSDKSSLLFFLGVLNPNVMVFQHTPN